MHRRIRWLGVESGLASRASEVTQDPTPDRPITSGGSKCVNMENGKGVRRWEHIS